MRNNETLFKFDLQLFNDGGAAGAAPSGEGTQQAGENALAKADTNRSRGSSRRGRSGAYDNVVFGKQDAAAETAVGSAAGNNAEANGNKSGISTTSDTLEARRKAYQDFVDSPENKDIHTETIQRIIDRRFKEVKGMEQTIADQKPILDMLAQRYGIADGDMKKLMSAIEEDTSYWQEAADKEGLTVEQYKAMNKLQRENAELQKLRQRQQGEQQAQAQLARWMQEAEGMKELDPGFDLRTEIQNRDFQGLLKSGVPVQKAYELMHMEEIKQAAARNAAQTASAQMQANLKAKAARPSENGTSSKSAAIVKNDVHSLSRDDRAEAVRRALRGEKISF